MFVYLVSYRKRILYSEQPTVLLAWRHLNTMLLTDPVILQTICGHITDYFSCTCTLKLKLYNYHRVFILICFWKIQKVEFALWRNFLFVVKQRPLFGKLDKAKKQGTLFSEKIYNKKWTHTFMRPFFRY